jgi:dTDP-4-amino-4,6-dideoxygalactose transaminase
VPDKLGVLLPTDQDASGRSLGDEELALLRDVIASGTLTSTTGTVVKRFECAFADLYGATKAVACSSGSAAVHAAVAFVDPDPGDEIVTSPITDMGALTPILYQGAVPVFADVDRRTGNVTPDSVAAALSDRTAAVVVTHLFGNPADVASIVDVASEHGVPVIEDCAHAYLARSDGRLAGTVGLAGCFSLQQGQHITCGEGGVVITDDPGFGRYAELWVNKGWDRGDGNADHRWLAGNARLTELQGAVAVAQLGKLESGVANRIAMADLLAAELAAVAGITCPQENVAPGGVHSYWRYPLHVDANVIAGGAVAMARILEQWGVPSTPRYIQKPAFRCGIFRDQKTLGTSRWPFTLARAEAVDYAPERFPGALCYLDSVLVLPWSERLTESHVVHIARAVRAAAQS